MKSAPARPGFGLKSQRFSVAAGDSGSVVEAKHALHSQPCVSRLRIAHLQGWKAFPRVEAAVRPRFVASRGAGVGVLFPRMFRRISPSAGFSHD